MSVKLLIRIIALIFYLVSINVKTVDKVNIWYLLPKYMCDYVHKMSNYAIFYLLDQTTIILVSYYHIYTFIDIFILHMI